MERRFGFHIQDRAVRHAKDELTRANLEFTRVHHMMTRAPETQRMALRRQTELAEKKLREAEARVAAAVAASEKRQAS